MSGIEIAGLVLGAIPVLIEGLQLYSRGAKSIRAGFSERRRVVVSTLTEQLVLQSTTLEEIVKFVLQHGGLEDVDVVHASWSASLESHEVRQRVAEYLGPKTSATFENSMQHCYQILQSLVDKVVSMAPDIKFKHEIALIRSQNVCYSKSRSVLLSRVRIAFGLAELEKDIEQLAQSVAAIHRLIGIVNMNRETSGWESTKNVGKLARRLQRVRDNAESVYKAIAKAWKSGLSCHQYHEASICLESRMQATKSQPDPLDLRARSFCLAFAIGATRSSSQWHETTFRISQDGDDPAASRPTKIRISHPDEPLLSNSQAPATSQTSMLDLCSALEHAHNSDEKAVFVLNEHQRMTSGTDPKCSSTVSTFETVTLTQLLEDIRGGSVQTTNAPRSPILNVSGRLNLAANLAASFLQLMTTQWTGQHLRSEELHFPRQTACCKLDLTRPFLSACFTLPTQRMPHVDMGESLIDLGIMLLEIWHRITLREWAAPHERDSLSDNRHRRCLASRWINECDFDMPQSYRRAVSCCIVGVFMGVDYRSRWDDLKMWEKICAEIVEPLSEARKSW